MTKEDRFGLTMLEQTLFVARRHQSEEMTFNPASFDAGIEHFRLQLLEGEKYRLLSERNRFKLQSIPAARGLVYDRYGQIIATNLVKFNLAIMPGEIASMSDEERSVYIQKLAKLSGRTIDEINQMIGNNKAGLRYPIVARQGIDYVDGLTLKISTKDMYGVSVNEDFVRFYPYSEHISHILGYLGPLPADDWKDLRELGYQFNDSIGRTGVELQYEAVLRGHNGMNEVGVDSYGRELSVRKISSPQKGADLYTTIDLGLQLKAEELLQKSLVKLEKKRGVVIALDPQNGNVLALVNIPSFNSNQFVQSISPELFDTLTHDENLPLFNRAISGEYPSGSTVKPVVAAAALSENIITKQYTVESIGGIRIGDWFFPDWKPGGHGTTDTRKALAWSVNTFFYSIGGGDNKTFKGLGMEKMIEYYKKFGLGSKTGIDLPGEADGFLPTKEWKEKTKGERWFLGDTYHLAIGQGDLLVTPLQLASMMMVFANRGTLYRPHLVQSVGDNGVLSSIVRDNIISPDHLELVRQGLRDAVRYGSARYLNTLPIEVAGKTGTAQFSTSKLPHSWFVGFAPYENPSIALVILIEEGEKSDYAVHIAKEILQWWYRQQG